MGFAWPTSPSKAAVPAKAGRVFVQGQPAPATGAFVVPVDKGVPLPPKQFGGTYAVPVIRLTKPGELVPWHRIRQHMAVGDSFFIAGMPPPIRIDSWIRGRPFTSRRTLENGIAGIRVWRI